MTRARGFQRAYPASSVSLALSLVLAVACMALGVVAAGAVDDQPANTSWHGATLSGGTASIVVPYRGSTTATGWLVDSHGEALDTTAVVVQTSTNGSAFATATLAVSRVATGTFSVTAAPRVKTYYRFVFMGDGTNDRSLSSPALVNPKVKLTTPTAQSTAKHGKPFTVTGKIYPAHRKGTKTVRMYYERRKGPNWVSRTYVWTRTSAKSSHSVCTASFKLKAGVYHFWLAAPADIDHAATVATTTVRVKVK
jgi:hypothetical protein